MAKDFSKNLQTLQALKNPSEATKFSQVLENTNQPARVTRVLDGDTFEAVLVFLGNGPLKIHVRLEGIDAPELKPSLLLPKKEREHQKQEAEAARLFLAKLLPENATCIIHCSSLDNFGRLLVKEVRVAHYNQRSKKVEHYEVVHEMLSKGYAVVWDGKKKRKEWSEMWAELESNRNNNNNTGERGWTVDEKAGTADKKRWWGCCF